VAPEILWAKVTVMGTRMPAVIGVMTRALFELAAQEVPLNPEIVIVLPEH